MMKRWRTHNKFPNQIVAEGGDFVCAADTPTEADRLIAEHNALVDAAEALQLKMSPFTNNQAAHDKALAALAKLEALK